MSRRKPKKPFVRDRTYKPDPDYLSKLDADWNEYVREEMKAALARRRKKEAEMKDKGGDGEVRRC